MSTPLSDPDSQRFRVVPESERTPAPELHPPAPVDVPQPEDRRRRDTRR